MDPQVKETLSFYAIWAAIIGLVTLLIRPFISVRQLIRDSVITFLVSFLCGLVIENFDVSIPFKCGISGIAGLFAIFIYNIIVKLLTQVEEDPMHYLGELKHKDK